MRLFNLLKLFKLPAARYTLITMLFLLGIHFDVYAQQVDTTRDRDCAKCHKNIAARKVVHPAIQMGCESCHSEPHRKNPKFPKGLSSALPDLCYGCHDKTIFSKKNVHPAIQMGCTSCHSPHSSDNAKLLLSEPSGLCFNCHDKKNFSGKKVVHQPVAEGMCTSCHSPHSSDNEKLLVSAPPDLCFKCHDKTKFESKIMHSPVSSGMCTFCHQPHQGGNDKLLTSPQPDLCFNCHDKTDFTRKNVHLAVKMGCTACHNPHADKERFLFGKSINATCFKCHANITRQQHIVDFGGSKGHPVRGRRVKKKETIDGKTIEKITLSKDPLRPDREFSCTSCHNPHSSDYIRLFRYKANSVFELCGYCHKNM